MKETFTDDLIALQGDPTYFSPDRLQRLKTIFDQICREHGILPQHIARRDKLATILLVGSKLYSSDEELISGAIKAMTKPGEIENSR